MQNLVYTNTFLVQSISLWNQVFRDTGPFFFCQKNGKKPCGNKKLQSYRVTELQSISPGNEDNFIFLQKKMKKSYRVTELQSYRPPLLGIRNSKLQSYRATGTIFFSTGKKSYKVTELQSYRTHFFFRRQKKVTELQSYRVTGHPSRQSGILSYRATELREPFFFPPGKKVTKLQSYRVTGHIFFFAGKKKLQSYRVTELQATPPGNQEF